MTNGDPLAPHPPLTDYYAKPSQRVPFVRRIFDDTAQWYDSITNLASFNSGSWYRRQALLRVGLKPGMKLLDVASGTGVVARLATSIVPVNDITCLDPSIGMLLAGREKMRLPLTQAGAEQIPFRSERFDLVTIGFAMRHFADLRVVFQEIHRVLKPGGKILILEITPPRSRLGLGALRFYMNRVVPAFAGAIGNDEAKKLMHYYWDTVQSCVPPETIMGALRDAGFASVNRHVELAIFSEYSGIRVIQ